ncbi:hypothetical protein GKZ89_08885 [Bacillus mangrovi]|uniref:Helicase/UvrB N-terminal domain-containing protein n=1 Tax=Metabacillus mangrovi TaxID=1491830 RepID=A0A7X2V498_9BACI|nr:DEAD/DEAH box helicase family protein [Metabacillus mangrovi]MTH53532.1 hypothetical protein [Metabacillus mangrovi]
MLCEKSKQTKINIIDSIMGSGKTSWAIQYMNEAPISKRFIYITPFMSEIARVIDSIEREFAQPEALKGETKLESLQKLIGEGKDIVSTHALFKRINKELIELIEIQGYTLIIDEVIDILEDQKIPQDDLKVLLSARNSNGDPIISVDSKGFVKWNDDEYEEGNFKKIRNLANAGNLIMYNNTALYWLFPVAAFKGFEEVFVMTYLFQGQLQRYYFDMFDLQYSYHSVAYSNGRYDLVNYIPLGEENRDHLKNLIRIHYSKVSDKRDLNKIGSKRNSFSNSDLRRKMGVKEYRKMIKDNAYNFYRHKIGVSTEYVMWTTFKDFKQKIQPTGLRDQFVEVTARATNNYADKSVCIYLANRYMNPVTKQFFISHDVSVDEDIFALSDLLQWIFRSRIRKGQPIDIYIPSIRMRNLLELYLND